MIYYVLLSFYGNRQFDRVLGVYLNENQAERDRSLVMKIDSTMSFQIIEIDMGENPFAQ